MSGEKYLTSNNENNVFVALEKIDINMQLPRDIVIAKNNICIGTGAIKWDVVRKSTSGDLWFFLKPDIQYMEGVTDVEELEYNADWDS